MPITVTAPRGVLTPAGEREILPQLTAALIEASGATGNSFFTSIVGGTVHLLDPHDIYAGGTNRPVVMVELKLPDIGLGTLEARAAFIAAATEIVEPAHRRGTRPGQHLGQHTELSQRRMGNRRRRLHRRGPAQGCQRSRLGQTPLPAAPAVPREGRGVGMRVGRNRSGSWL